MGNFFDLRQFLIICLRHITMVLVFILLGAALWGGSRLVTNFSAYRNGKTEKPAPQAQQKQELSGTTPEEMMADVTSTGLPYRFAASLTVYVPAGTGENEAFNPSSEAISAVFAACCRDSVKAAHTNQFFERAKEADAADRTRMVAANYRTSAFLEAPYSYADYADAFRAERAETNVRNVLKITVTQADYQLAKEMVQAYVADAVAAAQEEIGAFGYSVLDSGTQIFLPKADAGLTPKASVSSGTSGGGLTLRAYLVSVLKGCVWGAAAGFLLAVVVLFLMFVSATEIRSEEDCEKLGVAVLGTAAVKKPSLAARWIGRLEGRRQAVVPEQAARLVAARLPGKVVLTGSVKKKELEALAALLQAAGVQAAAGGNILYDAQTSALVGEENTAVVLLERVGASSTLEIKREKDALQAAGATVAGTVLLV